MVFDDDPIPIYFQIKNTLKSKILSSELNADTLLPSEAQLAKQYNISRGTARQALSELTKEGLAYRARGKGTFVSDGAGLRELRFKGTIENLIVSGREGQTRVLEYKEVLPPSHVAKFLGIEETQHVFELGVVFSSSKGPTRYTLTYFPPDLGKTISRDELKESTEILSFVENKLETKLHHARQSININLADKTVAEYLSVAPETPIFVMERRFLARDGSPLFMSISFCRPDLYKFRIDLTRT
jgi:GntR family transcriptional regulator